MPGTRDPVAQIRVQCRSGEKLNPAGASATGWTRREALP